MNIQIFGRNKCFDTKKAERYFKERRIKYQLIDLPRFGMSRRELESVRAAARCFSLRPLSASRRSNAYDNSASPARMAFASPNTLWLEGLPRRISSSSMAGRSS